MTRNLFDEIEALAASWPPQMGEPNLQDVPWLARAVMESLAVTLPDGFPRPDDGVGLVELVEAALLAPTPTLALREVAPAEVAHRSSSLVDEIRKRGWLTKDDASNFVAALLTWRGGIGMAKTLRDVDAAGTTYTPAHRRAEYSLLEGEWNQSGGTGCATEPRLLVPLSSAAGGRRSQSGSLQTTGSRPTRPIGAIRRGLLARCRPLRRSAGCHRSVSNEDGPASSCGVRVCVPSSST
jgi:hypothetical protein